MTAAAGAAADDGGRSPPARRRIVVFTGALSYSVRKGIVDIDSRVDGLEWLVLLQRQGRRSLRRLASSQRLNLGRNGWRWIPYTLAEVARRVVERPVPDPEGGPGGEYALRALVSRPHVKLVRTGDLHAAETLAAVRAFEPELGLSIAAPILRTPLFELPTLGTLNLHKGRLPDFRGMPPAFWEFWHDAPQVGCTVHRVEAKLDAGAVVAEDQVARAPYSTVRGMQLQLDEIGCELMGNAVGAALDGRAEARVQPVEGGRLFKKPTLAQIETLERRLRAAGAPRLPPRHAAKDIASTLVWHAWRGGGGRLLAPRITVLLYHRVSDDVRDNLTVGIEQFDRQMALLRRHCHVLPIEEVLAAQPVRRTDRPLVAVTFDDGYLDNFRHAAPILRRHAVPAAFFVSTGIIDTGGRFPHDLRRGNPAVPVMTWAQLRTMRHWGFTIGSHTVSHVDCAAGDAGQVRDELGRSRDDLRRELGVVEPIFAYPYGGRRHMTPERLAWVREAGYAGCLAAYGGSNVGSVDRWNVLRRGIHWEYTDAALLRACLGLEAAASA